MQTKKLHYKYLVAYLKLHFNDLVLTFKLDTGCQCSVIYKNAFDFITTKKEKKEDILCKLADGSTVITPSYTISFKIRKDSKETSSLFSVIDREVYKENGVEVHGLIGMQFLIQNQFIIDFKNIKTEYNE